MKKISIPLLLSLPFLLIGCDFQPTQPSQDFNNQLVRQLNEYLKQEQIHYYCLANGQDYNITINSKISVSEGNSNINEFSKTETCIGTPNPENSESRTEDKRTEAKNVRNEIIEQGASAIDANYAQYVSDLNLGRSRGNFVADVVELGISGVSGSLSGPADTLRILGVALNTFKGARASFDLNYFNKQTTAILVNQMDDNRNRVYAAILRKKDRDIDRYSMAEAIKDLVAYYNAGTLVRALTALSQQTGANVQQSENEIFDLQRIEGVVRAQPAKNPQYDGELAGAAADTIFEINKSLKSLEPAEKQKALSKLQAIFIELKNDPEFKTNLSFYANSLSPESPENAAGKTLISILIDLRNKALSAQNNTLLNKINQVILNYR